MNRELSLSFLATSKTIGQAVNMLGATEISSAVTLEDRLVYLPMLQAALHSGTAAHRPAGRL